MAQVRVDSLYDVAAIEVEQSKVIAALSGAKEKILELNNIRVGIKDSTMSEFTAQTTKLKEAIDNTTVATKQATLAGKEYQNQVKQSQLDLLELRKRNQELTIQAKEKLAVDKEAAAAAKDKSKADKQQAADAVAAGRERILQLRQEQEAIEKAAEAERSRAQAERTHLEGTYNPGGGKGNRPSETPLNFTVDQGNIVLLKQYESEISKLTLEMKLAKTAFDSGKISQSQYQQTVVLNTEKIRLLKANVSDLNKEMKLNEAVNATERNSLGRAQALIAQYTFAKSKLNTATKEGALLNQNYNKAIAATNEFILKNADAETIRSKSVGQYTSGIQKAFSGLRTLANIIPGIGLSGLFLIGFEAIEKAIGALGIFNKTLSDTVRQRNLLQDINKTVFENAGKELGALEALYSVSTNTTISIKDRKAAVDELQKQYPDYFKNIKDETILQGGATAAYSAAKDAILAKAKAQAISAKLGEIESKDLETLQKKKDLEDKRDAAQKKRNEIDASTSKDKEARGLDQFNAISELGKLNAAINDSNKDLETSAKDRKFLLDQIAEVPKGLVTTTKAVSDHALSQLKESLDTEFEIRKIHLQDTIDQYQHDIKSDRVYYQEKLAYLDEYIKAEDALLKLEEDNAIAVAKTAAEREKKSLEESKVGKTSGQKARIDENIAIVEKNLQQQINLIVAQFEDKRSDLVQAASDERLKIVDDHLKSEEALYKEYADKEADVYNATLDRFKKALDEREKLDKENKKKLLDAEKELNRAKADLAIEGTNFLFTIATANLENALNSIQVQKDAIDKSKEAELAANDATVQSEEKKAANVILINARAQSEKDALDRRAAQIEYRKAQFERGQQIFEIGIQTIRTIADIKLKALAVAATPIIGKFLAAQTLALIPLALAGAALSIGSILAAPLPRYKTGRGKGREELAVTGDGGVSEYILSGTGKITKTPAVETLTHLMPDDQVFPNKAALLRSLALNMPAPNFNKAQDRFDTEKLATRIEDAVSNIRIHTTNITKEGWRQQNQRLDEYNKWVNQQIKN